MPPRSANADFWAAIGRTVYFAGFTLVGSTLLGLAMALVLNQRFVGRGLLRSFVLVPWAMAPVSVGVLWSFIYAGNYGALTGLLDDLGLGRFALPWLGDGFRALNLVALTQVWSQAPLTALMLLAGLQSMPDSLRRAAMLDGAGPVARFFAITLPWLKPSLLFISIVTTINSLMAFDILWIMTRGGPGAATTVSILARLPHGLPVPAIRRRGEPPLFPHGAELPLGDRLFRGVQPAAQSSACSLRGSR